LRTKRPTSGKKSMVRPAAGAITNRQFAAKMHSIGLMPSATGTPGGAVTGDQMSHYILPDGHFIASCRQFLERYRLTWESAIPRREPWALNRTKKAGQTYARQVLLPSLRSEGVGEA
jgi:hypothetical protein